jgi:hypothetical protein
MHLIFLTAAYARPSHPRQNDSLSLLYPHADSEGELFIMAGSCLKIIACATVIEALRPRLSEGMTYEVLDFGLHLTPEKLRHKLQDAIDATGPEIHTLLLGYGLCSLAVVGLKATTATLIVPRVDDCIAIFLGSAAAYQTQAQHEPGTYYLTKGWIEVSDTPFTEYTRLLERYGPERAMRMSKLMLKNYTRLAFIDTDHDNLARYHAYAHRMAEQFDLYYEELPGSTELIKKLLSGPWDKDFVVARPGETIRYVDFR